MTVVNAVHIFHTALELISINLQFLSDFEHKKNSKS